MQPRVDNQIALVTGAGRGIGRAIALSLAERGARVFLAARTREQLSAVEREITARGGKARAVVADVAIEEDVTSLFKIIQDDAGRLDVLINNAGVGAFGALADLETADFDQAIAVNLRGTFLCTRHALRMMRAAKSGAIINIVSVVGFKGYPNQGAYTASKHGIMGLTKTLAVEAQEHGIRVSAVLPGGVDTEMIGDARPDIDRSTLLKPEDIAAAVLFLLSLPPRAAIDEIYIRRSASKPF